MILSSENLLCSPNPSFSFFFLPKTFFSLKGLFESKFFLIFDWINSLYFLSIIASDSFSFLSFLSSNTFFEDIFSFIFKWDDSLSILSIIILSSFSIVSLLISNLFFEIIFSFSSKFNNSLFFWLTPSNLSLFSFSS